MINASPALWLSSQHGTSPALLLALPGSGKAFNSLEWMLEVAHTNAFLHDKGVETIKTFHGQSTRIFTALVQKPLKAGSVLFFHGRLCRSWFRTARNHLGQQLPRLFTQEQVFLCPWPVPGSRELSPAPVLSL